MLTTVFHRAPFFDSPEQVVAHLVALGCTEVEVHRGPDGSYRGSGVARFGVQARDRREAAE